ncbi:hypothetical protein D3C87_2165720 [compost metagenome]
MAATCSILSFKKNFGPAEPINGIWAAADTFDILRISATSWAEASNSYAEITAAIGSPPGVSYSEMYV